MTVFILTSISGFDYCLEIEGVFDSFEKAVNKGNEMWKKPSNRRWKDVLPGKAEWIRHEDRGSWIRGGQNQDLIITDWEVE